MSFHRSIFERLPDRLRVTSCAHTLPSPIMTTLTSRSVLLDLLRPYRLRIIIAGIALIIAASSMLGVGQALRLGDRQGLFAGRSGVAG